VKIADTHFHLWDLKENYYPWLSDGDRPSVVADYSSLRKDYLVANLLEDMGTLDVVAGVHIQAEHDPRDHVRETRWVQRVADDPASRGFPHAIVANADLAAPDAERVLEAHCGFPNMRGIRQAVHRRLEESPPYDPLLDPAWLANFHLMAKYRLSFDLQLFAPQADAAVALIRRHPDVQFILTHAGMPLWPDAERRALWRAGIVKLAALPNVAVKISGFGLHDATWDAKSIDPIVAPVVEAFTPARCMLASNYPVERVARTYADVWRIYGEYFAGWSLAEREALYFRNALRYYRIDPN
jgi:predicted TIM-barrel fold metal-dependent hydrolase